MRKEKITSRRKRKADPAARALTRNIAILRTRIVSSRVVCAFTHHTRSGRGKLLLHLTCGHSL